MTIKLLYIFTLSIIFSYSVQSQEILNNRYGLFGNSLIGIHTADFPWLPQTQSCCSGFTGSTDIGINVGLLFESPLSENLLFGTRVSYFFIPFSMITPEPINSIIVNGVGQKGAFEHKLFGSYTSLAIEPMINLQLNETWTLNFGASVNYIVSSNYTQIQQITEPSGVGTFLDSNGNDSHKRTRNEFSGSLPNPKVFISPFCGVSVELPMNKKKTLLMVPELFYQIGITNLLSDVTWKTNAIRLGISVKYSPVNEPFNPIPIEKEPIKETPVIITQVFSKTESKQIEAFISAVGVNPNGDEVPNPILKVEEFTSTLMTSLLSYIFFPQNSAEIPQRYNLLNINQTKSFSPENINSANKLTTYYHLLNIIGKRMQLFPNSKITLIGCTDEQGEEKGNLLLSKKRAESIKNYLTSVWKISDTRITIQQRLLPSKHSNSMTSDGAEENRRVEIITDNDTILAPIITNDTLRTVSYPTIRFKPTIKYQDNLEKWRITAIQNTDTLKVFSGISPLPESIDWQLSGEKSSIPKLDYPVQYSILIKDSITLKASYVGEIKVHLLSLSKKRSEKRGDKEIDLYSLMLFDVKSAELNSANKLSLQFIKKRIKNNASIVVMGYTDRLGEVNYNQTLADSRAKSVAAYLGKSNSITAISKGISNLYDNDLPEGRFYSRTVEIEVQTPIIY